MIFDRLKAEMHYLLRPTVYAGSLSPEARAALEAGDRGRGGDVAVPLVVAREPGRPQSRIANP
jgi:hypothetical protein